MNKEELIQRGKELLEAVTVKNPGHGSQLTHGFRHGKKLTPEKEDTYRKAGVLDKFNLGKGKNPKSNMQAGNKTNASITRDDISGFTKEKISLTDTQGNKMKPISAEVKGDYAVHKDGKNYVVTHVPTGAKLYNSYRDGEGYDSEEQRAGAFAIASSFAKNKINIGVTKTGNSLGFDEKTKKAIEDWSSAMGGDTLTSGFNNAFRKGRYFYLNQ